ncbi:MAG: phage tail tape measure protein [Chloroflexi bacterium]|nr:phage tail tape measure protein [Chloroflexota bacterium]
MAIASGIKDFEKNLVRLQIAAGKTPAQMDAMRQAILDVSKATGVSNDDILAGTQAYVDLTGDINGAEASMSTFARVAQASGASVADVASAAAALKQAGVGMDQMEATFSGMITQGKAGAVSLKDFAGELSKLAPRWAKFNEGMTTNGVSQLGAAFQIARQGFGSASEAATGLQATMGALTLNARQFEAAGVKVYDTHKDGSKTLRTFEQILGSIEQSKLIKDPTLMTKALGSSEAEQTVAMLLKSRQALAGTTSEYDKLIAAGMDAGAVQRDLSTYLTSSSGRMEIAMNNLKVAVVEAFTPERIAAFVNMVEKLAEGIGSVVSKIGEIRDSISGKTATKANPHSAYSHVKKERSFWDLGTGSPLEGINDARDTMQYQKQRANMATVVGYPGDAARKEIQQEGFYNKSSASIEAGGSTQEKIRRAVMESYAGNSYDVRDSNSGYAERRRAGEKYLEGEGVSTAKKNEIYMQQLAENFRALPGRIAEAIRDAPPTIKMDSSKVSTATDNAPAQRRAK